MNSWESNCDPLIYNHLPWHLLYIRLNEYYSKQKNNLSTCLNNGCIKGCSEAGEVILVLRKNTSKNSYLSKVCCDFCFQTESPIIFTIIITIVSFSEQKFDQEIFVPECSYLILFYVLIDAEFRSFFSNNRPVLPVPVCLCVWLGLYHYNYPLRDL